MLGYLLIGAGLGLILQEIGSKKGGEAREKNDTSVVVDNFSRKLDSTAEATGGDSCVIEEPKAPKEVKNDAKRNDDQSEFASSPGGAGDNLSN